MRRDAIPVRRHDPGPIPRALELRLAGVGLAITTADPELGGWLEERFASFRRPSSEGWSIDVRVDAPTPPFLASPREAYPEPVTIEAEDDGFRIAGATFRARVCRRQRRVELVGPRATYPLDGVLRLLLPVMVEDGLLVHGGMLVDGSRGWAFSGPSGSGKSTLSRLLGERSRCDEMVALRRLEGGWFVQSMPFWRARPDRALACGLLMLRHGAGNRRVALGGARAAQLLSREILWPVADDAAMARRFELFGRLLAELPMWELWFRPTPEVWSVIEAGAA